MNLSAIMRIPDQATRNLLYIQSQEIDRLRAEVETLKNKSPNVRYRPMKGGEKTLEMAFKKVT